MLTMRGPTAALWSVVRAILIVAGAMIAVFFITHAIGSPVALILPLTATHAQYVALSAQLGLNRPLLDQFGHYAVGLLHGTLGNSVWQKTPALPLALDHTPATLYLVLLAMALAAGLGIPLGFLAAIRSGKPADKVATSLGVLGASVPVFWFALVAILVFSVKLGWLPTTGYGLENIVLPAISVAIVPFGRFVQLARSSMQDELAKPYMRAVRAKGYPLVSGAMRNAAKNALLPVFGYLGWEFATLIGAEAIIAETIFQWPGLSYLTVQALQQRDYPLIEACVLVIATIVVVIKIITDLCYVAIDPRGSAA